MVHFKTLKTSVEKFQKKGTRPALEHYHDLKYTSLRVYNAMCGMLRNEEEVRLVDVATSSSNVLCDVDDTIKASLFHDEIDMKRDIFHFYHNEGVDAGGMNYVTPVSVHSFKSLCRADNKVKDLSFHIVIKMYEKWCGMDLKNRSNKHPDYRYPVGAKWTLYSDCCRPGKPCSIQPLYLQK